MGDAEMKVKKENIYYFILYLYTIYCVFGSSYLTDIFLFKAFVFLIRYIVLIYAGISTISNIMGKKKPQNLMMLLFFVLSFVVCYYNTEYMEILWFVLIVFCSTNRDIDRIIDITLKTTIVCVCIVVIFSGIGIINSNDVTAKITGYVRHACGFRHVNYFGGLILKCFSCYVYKHFGNWKPKDYLIGVILGIICYFYIVTRTCAFSLFFSIAVIFLIKVLEHFSTRIKNTLLYALIYFVVTFTIFGSILVSINYPKIKNGILLDQLFSNRISAAYSYYVKYGISILGQHITLTSTLDAAQYNIKALVLDNSYMHLLIHCGVVIFFLVVAMYFILLRDAIKQRNYTVITILLIYLLCSVSEKWLFMPQYNICCFLISTIAFFRNSTLEEWDYSKHVINT